MNAEEQKEICVFCTNLRPIRGLGGFGASADRAPGTEGQPRGGLPWRRAVAAGERRSTRT